MRKKAVRTKKAVKTPRKGAAPKTRNHKTWADWEYFGKVRAALRTGFRYWIPMQLALQNASRPSKSLNKKIKKEYQCAKCKGWFTRKEVQIDHIEECGSLNCYEDIVPFLQKLTKEDVNAYQVLCKPDHSAKTKEFRKNLKDGNEKGI